MIKKLLRRLFYKIYKIGKFEFDNEEAKKNQEQLSSKAIIGENTILGPTAIFQNSTGDSKRISIGKDCIINGYLLVYNHGGRLRVGDHCFIGPDCRIWSASNITIGNRVLIAHNVNIHDNNSHPVDPKERHDDFMHILKFGLREENDLKEKPVVIEDDVWIGFNSTILKGVTIGKGAIIGACSIITKDVPAYAVVVGNPPEIVKYVGGY